MNLKEFNEILQNRDPELVTFLIGAGGLRGLLDTASHEYRTTTLAAKGRIIRDLILECGINVQSLETAFVEVMQKHGYDEEYAKAEFHMGICRILDHLLRSSA